MQYTFLLLFPGIPYLPIFVAYGPMAIWPSVVYGSITLKFFCGLWTPIRTSDSTGEAKFKKSVFWDTLLWD